MNESKVVEERYGELLESMPDGIIIVDKCGRIVSANSEAQRLYGYERAELLGKEFKTLFPERFRASLQAQIANDDSQSQRTPGVECHGQRKDGVEFPVEFSFSPLKIDQIPFTLHTTRDISERKRMESALQAANQEFEAFTHSVSHDLRAPLRAIGGFSKMLLHDFGPQLPPEAERLLNVVISSADQIRQMIDSLLKISRLGRQTLSIQTVDTSALFNEVLAEFRKEIGERNIDVLVSNLPPCNADMALLKQVFANLLSNALKFSRKNENPRIEIGCQQLNGTNVFFVRDNGVGFDMQYADKLFGVFQRLHDQQEFEGTGVGLALVQRIIHRHRGKVRAEAEEGKGATFYFTIPAE